MALFFVLCLAAAASLSSAHPASESFNKLVNKAADDLADVVKETSDTVIMN
jgi:hypothetical protein